MRLAKWSVKNYRSISQLEFDLDEFTALIGRNNSGKSNITESLRVYSKAVSKPNRHGDVWQESIVRDQNEANNLEFDAVFSLSLQEQEELAANLGNDLKSQNKDSLLSSGSLSLIRHRVVYSSKQIEREEFWLRINGDWSPYRYRNPDNTRHIEQINNPSEYELSNVEALYYHTDRQSKTVEQSDYTGYVLTEDLRRSIREYTGHVDEIGAIRRAEDDTKIKVRSSLARDAANLSNVLHTLSQNQKEKYQRIASEYIEIMEGVTDLTTPIQQSGSVTSTTIEVIENKNSYQLDEISSGSMEILALLTKLVLAEKETSLLIIEEPELHLHPEAEREVLRLITEISEETTQILVTTHSDVFVNSTRAGQIVRVVRDGSTTCRAVDSVGQELEDLGYDKSGFLQASAVVFVEGKSDERVIKQLSKVMGYDSNKHGIEFVELDGEGNIKSDGRSLVKLLYSFDIPYLFVSDSHESDPDDIRDELVSHINIREGDWHTTPEHFYILSGYGIEDYLIQMPQAIGSVVEARPENILDMINKVDDAQAVLNQIFNKYLNAEYNKSEHGMLIAKHANESNIPEELRDLILHIQSLPQE